MSLLLLISISPNRFELLKQNVIHSEIFSILERLSNPFQSYFLFSGLAITKMKLPAFPEIPGPEYLHEGPIYVVNA